MQDMPMPHDEKPSLDMIKQALMKVIDDMTAMESDRLMPDERRPKPVEAPAAPVEEAVDLGEDDPNALSGLLGDADKADETGAMPEDKENDLPPEIMEVVRRKKAEQK